MQLRDYQINGIEDILEAWGSHQSVLFQMPTGTGKTTLFCEIARKFTEELHPGKKVLIITHRKELVEQVFSRLVQAFGMTAGIIAANYIGIANAVVQIASIQTLVRRPQYQKDVFSLVIIDEAHHALASTYRKLWDFYPSAKFLGVTATPTRTNGDGFEDLFKTLVTTPSVKWFIQNGHLADVRYYASHTPDISNIRIKAGDYDETELSEVMQDKDVMADLVQSYLDHARDKKMIVFAVNRAHGTKIVEKFNSSGIPAKAIDTYTPQTEREQIVQDFRNNVFKVLCNVNIFTEGFDCPDVDAVQLARPTKSLTLYLQQVGRCMRPHEGKPYGIILDNAGLWKEHGLPKMDRNWTLEGEARENICPDQRAIVGQVDDVTPGGASPPEESRAIRLLELGEVEDMTAGNLIRIDEIEQRLTDRKIETMKDQIEKLLKLIEEVENDLLAARSEHTKKILSSDLEKRKQELYLLQNQLQPQRFEQVLNLLVEKCQGLIDDNDIFVDGDKDVFLQRFIEPALRQTNTPARPAPTPRTINPPVPVPEPEEGQFEVFHYFTKLNKTANAIFDIRAQRITFNGEQHLKTSTAAVKANELFTGRATAANGWEYWKFIDEETSTEEFIKKLRR
jgi:superfamily II DNA or RNA helicase